MTVFIDTSAFYALLDRDDANHARAKKVWTELLEDLLPLAHIEWVDEPVHRSGLSALLAVSKRKLSLVDCVSFEIMRRQGIKSAFVFDPHFEEQGFHGVP
jgi:predicted nucleic acid-binding protein